MEITYSNYISRILGKNGVAPKFKYQVQILPPDILASYKPSTTNRLPEFVSILNPLNPVAEFGVISTEDNIGFNCVEAVFPGRVMMTTEYRYNGVMKKQPYNVLYDEIQLAFLCDSNMREKKFFDDWITGIYDDKYNFNYMDSITGNLTVTQLDLNLKEVFKVNIFDAYPTAVQPLSVDASATDFQRLDVRFYFRDFERVI